MSLARFLPSISTRWSLKITADPERPGSHPVRRMAPSREPQSRVTHPLLSSDWLSSPPQPPVDTDLATPRGRTSPVRNARPWRDRFVLDTIALLLGHRVLCTCLVIAAGAAGVLVTMRIDPYYIAHATIFPSATSNP